MQLAQKWNHPHHKSLMAFIVVVFATHHVIRCMAGPFRRSPFVHAYGARKRPRNLNSCVRLEHINFRLNGGLNIILRQCRYNVVALVFDLSQEHRFQAPGEKRCIARHSLAFDSTHLSRPIDSGQPNKLNWRFLPVPCAKPARPDIMLG